MSDINVTELPNGDVQVDLDEDTFMSLAKVGMIFLTVSEAYDKDPMDFLRELMETRPTQKKQPHLTLVEETAGEDTNG